MTVWETSGRQLTDIARELIARLKGELDRVLKYLVEFSINALS